MFGLLTSVVMSTWRTRLHMAVRGGSMFNTEARHCSLYRYGAPVGIDKSTICKCDSGFIITFIIQLYNFMLSD